MAVAKEKNETYFEGIGRRKTARARVRLYPSNKTSFVINENERSLDEYFPTKELRTAANEALETGAPEQAFTVSARIAGGGIAAQAEALRHGIARALVVYNPEQRTSLKREGFLKRDPREKERRKFGLKKARKRAQWSKR